MEKLMKEVEKWSKKYDFTFQFWNNNNTVYIEVGLVDLFESGNHSTPKEAIEAALKWIYAKNRVPKGKRIELI